MKKVKPKIPAVNRAVARKVLDVVDKGLVFGMGNRKPGEMCVEAAVCFALGLPHGDNPKCVGSEVREFKIGLNDQSGWQTPETRASGLRRVAVAQLGSNKLDQEEFSYRLTRHLLVKLVAPALKGTEYENCQNDLNLWGSRGQVGPSVVSLARYLMKAASGLTATALECSRYNLFQKAVYALVGDASANVGIVEQAVHYVRSKAIPEQGVNGKVDNLCLKVLQQAAECAVKVLIEMKSPGAAWLDLTVPQKKAKPAKKVATKAKK